MHRLCPGWVEFETALDGLDRAWTGSDRPLLRPAGCSIGEHVGSIGGDLPATGWINLCACTIVATRLRVAVCDARVLVARTNLLSQTNEPIWCFNVTDIQFNLRGPLNSDLSGSVCCRRLLLLRGRLGRRGYC